jgi:hypothetical protein
MILTERLIYLQLQKTGCTHIGKILLDAFAGKQYAKHFRVHRKVRIDGRLVAMSIRNPWDFYVSLWAFGCAGNGDPYERSVRPRSVEGALKDFRTELVPRSRVMLRRSAHIRAERARPVEAWQAAHADAGDPQHFRDWLRLTLDPERRFDLSPDYGYSPISSAAGLFTYLFLFLSCRRLSPLFWHRLPRDAAALETFYRANTIVDAFIRMEHLEADLIEALERAGYTLTDAQMSAITNTGITNASKRARDLSVYYDNETCELVREHDAFLIDRFGYEAPLPPVAADDGVRAAGLGAATTG